MDPSLGSGWPDDLPEIIYIDHYGNGMTGLRATVLSPRATLRVRDHVFSWAETFAAVKPGEGFWYENSSGLVEIAVSGGSTEGTYGLRIGDAVEIQA